MTLLPLIAAIYFLVAGGPFGLEDIVSKSGYTGAILILLVTPVIWAVPTALMVSELSSALPDQGGYYVWVTRGMGRFWGFQEAWLSLAGSVFDVAIYPTLFVSLSGPPVAVDDRRQSRHRHRHRAGGRRRGVEPHGREIRGRQFRRDGHGVARSFRGAHRLRFLPSRRAHRRGGSAAAMSTCWAASWWRCGTTWGGITPPPWPTRSTVRSALIRCAMAGAVALVALTYVLPIAAVAVTGLDANRWSTGRLG